MSQSRVPAAPYEFRHRQPVQIRFNDIDMLGHLNNSVYIQLMDLGKANYFHQFIEGRLDHDKLAIVVANINCDFHAPAYLEERLEVLTAVETISEKSLRLEQRVINADTGDVKCRAITTMVNIDPHTGRAVDITAEWRARLSEYEQREL